MIIDPEALDRLLADAAASGGGGRLPELAELTAALRREAEETRVRVAFVGEFSHGKSQVINSLLGDSVLPATTTPTTRVLTEVAYGDTPEAALVTATDAVETVPLERFAAIEQANGYRRARVRVPVDWLREFVLIDTPGIGEPEDVAAELVYEELPRADVIVFVLHAQAALKRSERRFLSERLLRQDRAKVVFLLNQIDHLQPEEVTELEGYVQRQLATLVPHPTLLTYSALDALRGRLTGDAALLERANYPAVARVLVDELRADRERLRQVNALLQLRQGLEAGRAGIEAREEALRLNLAELDERLARLEGEQARFHARLDRVAAHAAGHLDLITRHLETELQALRLRVDRELPKLLEGADPVQLRKQLPFYLEHLVKGYLEWQLPALEARLAELYAEIDDELSAAVAEALRGLDLQPGYLAAALRTRPAHYDKATQASRFLGVTGMIALLLVRLPLAAGMLAASQALRYLARGRREAAERGQMVEAGRRAMRAGLERASEDLGRQLEDYKRRVVTALRAEGEARMASVTASLKDARSARAAAEAQRAGPAGDWAALGAELDALLARVAAYEMALAGDKPADGDPV